MHKPNVGTSTYDLAIVGAGAAGLAAAIEAGEAGLRAVLIEAFCQPGGAAATASALTCIVDSRLQRANGITDSLELALDDWVAWGGESEVDIDWARMYLQASNLEIYEWLESFGVRWESLIATEGNSVPRQHRPSGGGPEIVRLLLQAARALPIEWLFSATVTELIWSGGAVTGLVARSRAQERSIQARAVLFATGGFANSSSMLEQHGPRLTNGGRLLRGGAEQATGLGHDLLTGAGADFIGMDRVWMYAYGVVDPADPEGARGLAFWLTNDIWVDATGRRFHDESRRGGATATPALLARAGSTCWSIFDSIEAAQVEIPHPRFRLDDGSPDRAAIARLLSDSPSAHVANTFEELAAAAALPVVPFAETMTIVRSWNEPGFTHDSEFGRPLAGFRPLDQPPFYAVQFLPLARKCLGGVRTDLSGRVLRPDSSVIEGLFAAGELAGMGGGHMNGRAALEGTMFGPSLFSGRVASRTVARAAGVRDASSARLRA